jgi:hypothetical protein
MDLPCMIDYLVHKRLACEHMYECNMYRHMACTFKQSGKHNHILTTGHNKYTISYNLPNIHAEIDAFLKLKDVKKKHFEHVNLCVIRMTKNGKLSNSKPCVHCILQMNALAQLKGYKIDYVFYSDTDGLIQKVKFSQCSNDHVTRFFKERNFQLIK